MFPNKFDYVRATSVAEAIDLLEEYADADTEILAGGHSLLPTIKSGLASPEVVVDISGLDELAGLEIGPETTTFGATTTYADVLHTDGVYDAVPDVAETVEVIGDRQVRNAGTMGGNLAHADPASDLPAVVVAADATIQIQGPDGERAVPASEFFIAMYTTDLGPSELITAIEVPNVGDDEGATYVKKKSPSSGYAMVGVAARLRTDGDSIEAARLAANGAFDHAQRLEAAEDALVGATVTDDLAATAAGAATDGVEEWELMDDIQVSSDFRGQLLEVYTERAIQQALDRVGVAVSA